VIDDDRRRLEEALPGYELGDHLGRGAFGVVIAGHHRGLGRDVAIKRLPRQFAEDPEVRARFAAEARLLASLDHAHIVPVYDFVEHDGMCLLVMERLTGGTVGSRQAGDGFRPEAACALVLAACAALQHAHDRGVLHRDVKPENLMFDGREVLKVADFGIAKVLAGATTAMTQTGFILGTPAYIAPEQAEGGDLSPSVDVYALGTVLYELLAGELPFPATQSPLTALYQRVHDDPRPLSEAAPDVPEALARVVTRSLARHAADRYESAQSLGSALAEAATETWGESWARDSGITLREIPFEVAPVGALQTQSGLTAPTLTAPPVPPTQTPPPSEPPPAREPSPTDRQAWRVPVIATAALVVLIAVVAALVSRSGQKGTTGTARNTATSTSVGEPETVARSMIAAFNRGDDNAASAFFAPSADVLGTQTTSLDEVKSALQAQTCGATLNDLRSGGTDVLVAASTLLPRGGRQCAETGNTKQTTINLKNGKIVSWVLS
jgi:serine/threonine protein kinase